MKTWLDFRNDEPEIARIGKNLLLRSHPAVGRAFLATLRNDGAPRLHPVSVLIYEDHLYLASPRSSPKCGDLLRDDRFALQAFPSPDDEANEEFYLAGSACQVSDTTRRQAVISGAGVIIGEGEVLFELFLERAMLTRLVDLHTPAERPVHHIWRANPEA